MGSMHRAAWVLFGLVFHVLIHEIASTTPGGAKKPSAFAGCSTKLKNACSGPLTTYVMGLADARSVMTCFKGQRLGLTPVCQEILDRMDKNDLGMHLMDCVKNGARTCFVQMMSTSASTKKAPDQTAVEMFRCLNRNSAQLSAACQTLVKKNFLDTSTSASTPSSDCDPGECNGATAKAERAASGNKATDNGGGSSSGVLVFFLIVALVALAGAVALAVYYRSQLSEARSRPGDVELAQTNVEVRDTDTSADVESESIPLSKGAAE